MAATYSQLGQICQQPDFQQRVAVAMNIAAVDIYAEGTGVTGHAARAAYAVKVLAGTYNLNSACLAVMQSATIQGTANPTIAGDGIADTDLQTQVNGIWNALAGA